MHKCLKILINADERGQKDILGMEKQKTVNKIINGLCRRQVFK